MKRSVLAAALAAGLVAGASAEEEPFGQGFDGWSFTQEEGVNGGIVCAAKRPGMRLARNTNGKAYIGHEAKGVPDGTYPEAYLGWFQADANGVTSEMSEGQFTAGMLFFFVDDTLLGLIADGGGFEYRIQVGSGFVENKITFTSGGLALSNLMDCVTANGGGATAAAPSAPPAQDDPFAEEPFGEGFDGWEFTQQQVLMGGIGCHARFGNVSMSRLTEGRSWLSIKGSGVSYGFRKGDAALDIGRVSEMTDSNADDAGGLTFFVEKAILEQVAVNRGYAWSVAGKSGTVKFPDSAISALGRVEECIRANGG